MWLTDYFDTNGEPMPNRREIAYDPRNIKDMWEEYKNCPIVNELTNKKIEYAQFTKLIREAFPDCIQRPYKSVTGKCSTCEKLRNLARNATLKSDKIMVREFRQMHRNLVVGEKIKYYERQREAIESNGNPLPWLPLQLYNPP